MKFFVTGANGMFGSDFCRLLEQQGHSFLAATRAVCDITDAAQVRAAITNSHPDVVVHAAAATNVDACERDPLFGYQINTIGTQNVALASEAVGATMVYVSSCGVFDGTKGEPYHEFDPVGPRTHYHRSKYLGEAATVDHCRRHFVVRPGWLFGGSASHAKNFVDARRREALAKPVLMSARDRFGTPTYTVDFAQQILTLVESEIYGLYHTGNVGYASRYEYVRAILKFVGSPVEVKPVGSDAFPRSAPVPVCEAIDDACLRLRGLLTMRPWEEAMGDYVMNRLLPEVG